MQQKVYKILHSWLFWYISIGVILIIITGWNGPKPLDPLDVAWRIVCKNESTNNPRAYNKKENAIGIAQIRPIMIRDVNRILGSQVYVHQDAYDPVKARQMFMIFQKYYHPNGTPEIWIKSWRSGP